MATNRTCGGSRHSDGGRTPLYRHVAAMNGHAAVVDQLVAAGTAVDKATTNTGAIPLLVAAKGGHEAVVRRLLAAGADANRATTCSAELTFAKFVVRRFGGRCGPALINQMAGLMHSSYTLNVICTTRFQDIMIHSSQALRHMSVEVCTRTCHH